MSTSTSPVTLPGMPGTSGPRLLLSVYPKEQTLELRHKGYTVYRMAASKKGEHQTLLVNDTVSYNRNFHAEDFQLYAAPVPASAVADNLIQRWSFGMVGTKDGLGPGIIICAGLEPTGEEIAQANAKQEAYFRYLINEADALEHKNPNDITDIHRMAAEWMGVKDRKWFHELRATEMRRCPACDEEIRGAAKICKHCHTNIETFEANEANKAARAAKQLAKPEVS